MGAEGSLKARLLREWLRSPNTSSANVIVTSRVEDYDGELKLGSLPVIAIQVLNEQQIRKFVRNYLQEQADLFFVRVGALYDDSLQVQIAAIEALGRTGGESVNDALVAFTSNNISKIRGQFELRSAIVSRLASIKTDEARKLLEELVN